MRLRRPVALVSGVLVSAVGLATALAATRVSAALVAPPPGLARPSELVSLLETTNGERGSRLTYQAFRAIDRTVPDVMPFAWDSRDLQVIAGRDARVWPAAVVTGGYFGALGARASAGRLIAQADDDQHGNVAIVSWRMSRALADRPDQLPGQPITINGHPFTVLGVTAPGFIGLDAGHPIDLWLPMSSEPDISTPTTFPDGHRVQGFINTPGVGFLVAAARIPPGANRAGIEDRLGSALRSVRDRQPDRPGSTLRAWLTDRPWIVPFTESRAAVTGAARAIGWAVALTLVLTAAGLGALFVGRYADRSREFSIRLALGATRARLLRGAALEMAGVVAAGALIAWPAGTALVAAVGDWHLTGAISVDDAMSASTALRGLAMLCAMAAAVTAAAAVGALLFIARVGSSTRIESTRVTGAGAGTRRLLLAAQVGAGCALINAALLLSSSIASLERQPLGFDAAHVVYAETDPAGAGLDAPARAALAAQLAAHPWPAELKVAYVDTVPYAIGSSLFARGDAPGVRAYPVGVSRVSTGYFDVLGIRLLGGRDFRTGDAARPSVIVSEPLARMYWPDGGAVGRTLFVGGTPGAGGGAPYEVIGIVAGVRQDDLRAGASSWIYLPYTADAEALTFVARAGPAGVGRAATEIATLPRSIDPRLVVGHRGVLIDLAWRVIERSLLLRFLTTLIGVSALALVGIGVWGLSYATLRRRWREFGIRQALGASRVDIARRAAGDAIFVSVVGGAIGVVGGWQLGTVLQSFLFGVAPHDPVRLAVGIATVTAAAVIGALPPAKRALGIDAARLLAEE